MYYLFSTSIYTRYVINPELYQRRNNIACVFLTHVLTFWHYSSWHSLITINERDLFVLGLQITNGPFPAIYLDLSLVRQVWRVRVRAREFGRHRSREKTDSWMQIVMRFRWIQTPSNERNCFRLFTANENGTVGYDSSLSRSIIRRERISFNHFFPR